MKILLVIPCIRYQFEFPYPVSITDLPVGMAYIAAALKDAAHYVFPVDLNNRFDEFDAPTMVRNVLRRAISDVKPDMILTGGLCTDYPCLKQIISVCKHETDAPIVLGGGIVTHDPWYIPYRLGVDYGVYGEAEQTIVRLVNGEENQPNVIKFADQPHELSYTCPPIDSLSFPDYSIFGDWQRWNIFNRQVYGFPQEDQRPWTIVAGRSCPFHCSFCIQNRTPYRARTIKSLVDEILTTKAHYDFNLLIILDELFATSPARLREFSQAVIDNKLEFSWTFQTHATARLDADSLRLAKRAGLYMFWYGIETCSPTVLKSMDKRTSPDLIAQGVRVAAEAGVGFGGNLIFGDPAENSTTVAETVAFTRKHLLNGSHLFMSSVQPYPGSKLFRDTICDHEQYYETIDQCRWNMTKLPSLFWMPWLALISWMGGEGHHLRAVKGKLAESDNIHFGIRRQFWKAFCPHCQRESQHHLARVECKEQQVIGFKQGFLNRVVQKAKHHWLGLQAILLIARVLSLFFPWWHAIIVFHGPAGRSFRTGCPHCFKSFRVMT